MPDVSFAERPDGVHALTIQINFDEHVSEAAFDRAECWTKVGGNQESQHYGACTYTVLYKVDSLPEPSGALGVLLIALAAFAKHRRTQRPK